MKKDMLELAGYNTGELQKMLELAIDLKKEFFNGGNEQFLSGKVMAMIFQKPSLRTRVSFDMAMRHFGGDALYLSPMEIGLGKRESVADVARVLSGYVDIIMARVFSHQHILELGQYASIPVINGLSDYSHPCQGMTDAMTMLENFGHLKDLNVTYVGDGNNMAVSVMHVCAKFGANFTISNPDGYAIEDKGVSVAKEIAAGSGSKLKFVKDPIEAVKNADVIYTDTWTSMGQEEEAKIREKAFADYQVNTRLVEAAKKETIVMHCLPAHRNHELTDEVADGPQSVIFPQAHNRLHAQKGIIAYLFGYRS
ncbi:MAG: ornithine carbamoyltransferase [Anaerolineaceae bacterium]|nr:ornithine carbamoyltransferase [Anaerolineaceae bacterium]